MSNTRAICAARGRSFRQKTFSVSRRAYGSGLQSYPPGEATPVTSSVPTGTPPVAYRPDTGVRVIHVY